MTPQEGLPTKAKEAPSPHEVRIALLDTNPVFQCLGELEFKISKTLRYQKSYLQLSYNSKEVSDVKKCRKTINAEFIQTRT